VALLEPQHAPALPARSPAARPVDALDDRLLGIPIPLLDGCRNATRLIGGPNIRLLGVTSSTRGEGRTSVAEAMAAVQRQDFGRKVALVDMDFENPALAKAHDLAHWPGLGELSRGEASANQVLQPLRSGVQVVTAGAIAGNVARGATEVAGSNALTQLLDEVDVVIADLPPLLGGGVGFTLARPFQEILLVVRAGVTPIARVREAMTDLHVTPHIMLNGTQTSLPRWLRRLLGR
jgi:protein-tyrosine kinase